MTGSGIDDCWLESATIITNKHPQVGMAVRQFDFNLRRVGRPEGVDNRLARNPVHLVAHNSVKRLCAPLGEYADFRVVGGYAVSTDARQRRLQAAPVVGLRPETVHSESAFGNHVFGAAQCVFDDPAIRIRGR